MMGIAEPSGPAHPGLLFQLLRWQMFVNACRTVYGHSLIRAVSIVVASGAVWGFVFLISFLGFDFLRGPTLGLRLGAPVVVLLIDLLFLTLGVLLAFSSGLILYGSLFTSAETAFLLSKPVRADQVYAFKFQTAVGFSSLAFLLLGSPILIAYGLAASAPYGFYVLLPLFFVGYVLLPGALGGFVCLLIVNYFPRRRKQAVIAVVTILILVAAWWIWSIAAARGRNWNQEAVSRLLGRFSFASSELMPNHWVGRGLQAAAVGRFVTSLWYLLLVWVNGLFFYLVTAWLSARLYRRGFNRLATGGTLRRSYGNSWLDSLLGACLPFVHPGTRLLIIKDFRTFRRDPQQSGQVLIFVGLMLLYIMNIRRMFVEHITWAHQNSISMLNLFAVCLLLATYTGRFVYPMLSLEGRKFWVLGLLPIKRDQLLWGKFAFALAGCLLISESLVLLSDLMLSVPWHGVVLHVLTVAVIGAGLSGLSVGMGACMPNFRETDPSKIAVGFGGTLNLVIELGFLVLMILTMVLPWHLQMFWTGVHSQTTFTWWPIAVGTGIGLALGTAAVVLPLRAGIRALRRMEF
jgi:ABC-2 type transport system permease protein